jgi:hypothetical protein
MNDAFENAHALQNLMISIATGGEESTEAYDQLRESIVLHGSTKELVPDFVRTCRSSNQFWQFIKHRHAKYAERRQFIFEKFAPLLDALEYEGGSPSDPDIAQAISRFDSAHIQIAWDKARERRSTDPEGAITAARTLLESVCKHILDSSSVGYGDGPDLNKLYRLTAEQLTIAPSQHTEAVFKQILGGCTSVVEGLGALRNRLSDAHGKGKAGVRPAARHAELAVNLAGALATFLIATKEARDAT